jgi:hypothetical protein
VRAHRPLHQHSINTDATIATVSSVTRSTRRAEPMTATASSSTRSVGLTIPRNATITTALFATRRRAVQRRGPRRRLHPHGRSTPRSWADASTATMAAASRREPQPSRVGPLPSDLPDASPSPREESRAHDARGGRYMRTRPQTSTAVECSATRTANASTVVECSEHATPKANASPQCARQGSRGGASTRTSRSHP